MKCVTLTDRAKEAKPFDYLSNVRLLFSITRRAIGREVCVRSGFPSGFLGGRPNRGLLIVAQAIKSTVYGIRCLYLDFIPVSARRCFNQDGHSTLSSKLLCFSLSNSFKQRFRSVLTILFLPRVPYLGYTSSKYMQKGVCFTNAINRKPSLFPEPLQDLTRILVKRTRDTSVFIEKPRFHNASSERLQISLRKCLSRH